MVRGLQAGGFDSRSLAEIVVKERVRIAHGVLKPFASALGVEGGLTAGKDRQPLLTPPTPPHATLRPIYTR